MYFPDGMDEEKIEKIETASSFNGGFNFATLPDFIPQAIVLTEC